MGSSLSPRVCFEFRALLTLVIMRLWSMPHLAQVFLAQIADTEDTNHDGPPRRRPRWDTSSKGREVGGSISGSSVHTC